jgi:transcriptional regulator with XRE-family HTH domain
MTLSASQCRAARGVLNWSQSKLCEEAKVGRATLTEFENERREPYERTLRDIRAAFEAAGVQFVSQGDEAGGDGVVLRKP